MAGTGADNDRNKGAKAVFKKNPGIKVVANYSGMWDSATAQRDDRGAAAEPAARSTGSGSPAAPTVWSRRSSTRAGRCRSSAGEGENGFRKYMLTGGYHGQKVDGHVDRAAAVPRRWSRSSWPGPCSRASTPKKSISIPFPVVTTETVKSGETVFPDLPDSFFADFTDSGPNATV